MTVSERVRQYITANFVFGSHVVSTDESLLDRGLIDSTGVMELVSFIETEFSVSVSDQDLVPENLDSIAAITAFITRKLDQQKPAGLAAAAA